MRSASSKISNANKRKNKAYRTYKKKIEINGENVLLEEINKLEKETVINFELLDKKRNELQDIRNKKMEGVKLRSRVRWISDGEKATKYFCNLEKRNFVSKWMNSLIKENGSTTNIQSELLQETMNLYKKLYTKKRQKRSKLESFGK